MKYALSIPGDCQVLLRFWLLHIGNIINIILIHIYRQGVDQNALLILVEHDCVTNQMQDFIARKRASLKIIYTK